jgi:DNA repair protein RadC
MDKTSKHLNIKALAEDDRPREKLLLKGRHNLSDAELLAIVLGSGSKNETALQLAQRILSDNKNNINELAKLNLNDFKKYKGVGTVKAINLIATFELGRRKNEANTFEKVKITSSRIAYNLFNKMLSDLPHEEFWMLILNRANQVVKEEYISRGGIAVTVVDVRLICKSALENTASGIIIAHNHPSGQVNPSENDKEITKKLKEALKILEISLLDHLIIGDKAYFSFADEGYL